MATPHVAGVAALIATRDPASTPPGCAAMLDAAAATSAQPGRDPQFGYGRIDARGPAALVDGAEPPVEDRCRQARRRPSRTSRRPSRRPPRLCSRRLAQALARSGRSVAGTWRQ